MKHFIDRINKKDSLSIHKTNIIAYVEGTDRVLWKRSNKIVLAGSQFNACKAFNISPSVQLPTYNSYLGLDNADETDDFDSDGIRRGEIVVLFAVGTGGCGVENDAIYSVDYASWIDADSLIAFRYPLADDDLTATQRETYFGRRDDTDRIAYFFKAFDADPVLYQQYTDGTSISSSIYDSSITTEVETYVQLQLKITKDDCRDWIAEKGLTEEVDSLSLLTAYPITIDGYTYYQNIRPLSRLNFSNEPLVEENKGIDIVYQIFY